MRNPIRSLQYVLFVLLGLSAGSAAFAQNFPDKPLKLAVPYTAGGGVDTTARTLADKLGARLGQPVVVENKPGAGTMLATDFVAKSKPDGYTLLFGTSSAFTVVQHTYSKVAYKPEDLQPIAMVNTFPWTFTVNPEVIPVNNWKEFVDFVRANPGKVNFGSSGMGTSPHLLFELLKMRQNLDMFAVHYKGTALQDLLAGRIGMVMDSPPPLLPHYASGKLRALAVGGTRERISALPNVPTFIEVGVPELSLGAWGALFAPAGTPRPIVDKLYTATVAVVNDPDMRTRILSIAGSPRTATPEEMEAQIKADSRMWKDVVDKIGLKLD